ncbi:MAG: wax ester/triacylglycerol synthase family O-acyltransferase [Pseudomonadota bacterium]
MKQLSGMDATFLYMESPQTPMHVAGLTLYDPPEGLETSFHQHFLEFFKGRVHLIPIFGKKLAKTVFELDHPGWVDAGELDFSYHIQPAILPKPGSLEQLEELVADLHAQPVDLKKPLWQFTVIEGLASGQVALYSKVHHAAVDGGAGMVITQALYDLGPVPRKVAPPGEKPETPRKPTMVERAILGAHDTAANLVNQQLNMLEAVPKVMSQMASLGASALSGGLGIPHLMAPKTAFNGTIGQKRSYCARTISLIDVKAVAKASDSKVNDIVLAVCSGALRKYLNGKHKLPDATLTAFVPISTREAGNKDINNQVFGMNCALATNYSDPLKRLKKIKDETGTSKAVAGGLKDLSPKDFTILGAPMLLPALMNMYGRSGLADVLPNAVNVTISNNAGPPFPMYCAGAKVTALYPVSIPVHGVGLNFTVQSYLDKMDFGLTADHASVPDIAKLGDLLLDSFEELKKAVLPEEKVSRAKPKSS